MLFLERNWKEREFRFFALKTKKGLWIHYEGQSWFWRYQQESNPERKKTSKKKKNLIQAPLPGRIQKIFVKEQELVKKGQNLLTLSAMKIEYSFKSEGEGVIEEIFCHAGSSVSLDQNLIKIKYQEDKTNK